MNELSQKAMLIGLSISQWSARKLDRQATKKVAQDYGNQEDAARVNKRLIAEEAIKKVQEAATAARQTIYKRTLPWRDDGKRILPAAEFLNLTEDIRKLESNFWAAVTELEGNYPSLVQDARIMLNGLFDAMDYPDPSAIRGKYAFAVTIDPLPTAQDFRVDLQENEVKAIRRDIEERLQSATQEAMQDLWQRLYSAVSNAVDRLSQPEAIFRDSLIGNLEELVELLPRLNVTDDPQLETLRKAVADKLIKDPQVLREDKDERRVTAQEAEKILEAMGAFMNA